MGKLIRDRPLWLWGLAFTYVLFLSALTYAASKAMT